jgi:hypothetical protein
MLPGSLVPIDEAYPDHRASGCSPRRARPFGRAMEKCSWHLGMMMRIIETLSLKTQACRKFSIRNASHPHTPGLFDTESETYQPEVGRTHIAVHHRMTRHADGTLTAPSPHAHALTSRSPFVERLDLTAGEHAACSQDCADSLRVSVQDPLREPSFLTPQNSFHIRIPRCPRCIKISHRSLSLAIPAESLA